MSTSPLDGRRLATPAGVSSRYPLRPADEKASIERCLLNDSDAWNELIKRYESTLYRFAYSLCHNYEEAGDIVGQVLVSLYQNLHTFRKEGSFSSWLLSIARHSFLDQCVRGRRMTLLSLDEADENGKAAREAPDPAPSPELTFISEETARQLARAVRNLPGYQRVVLHMYYARGMSYMDIAEETGLSIGTVKSRLNRARTMLKARLDPSIDLVAA
ncbi:MAG TPA: sigma-70 family RNA polymerase sigma factor [Chthonomonadales bacterium]|nr:sigma-70 family RNA polymerase sigma factor [Chthonomonadales bacterium]